MNALDVAELRHALRRKPIEKLRRRARIGAARVRVANLGGEEFEEAIGSTGASRGDEGGRVSRGDGCELVHRGVTFTLCALCHDPKRRETTSSGKARRQIAIVVTIRAAHLAQIVTRPDELIALAHGDPGALVTEAKVFFDSVRNFDGRRRVVRRAMRHRQYGHQRLAILLTLDGERDDAGAILAAFFLPALRFVIPDIRVGNNEARLGRGNRHAPFISDREVC